MCVSEATARDAVDLLGARGERVVVAPHGPGQRLPRVERDPEPRHFLYVGDAEPRKNLAADAALRACLSERGRSWAGRLSWAGSARAHISAYTLALG